MKNVFILSLALNILLILFVSYGYYKNNKSKYFFDFSKYENVDLECKDSIEVYFIGNSIIANWINLDPSFFSSNFFSNKGVGGQTSTQMLLRFQKDIVSRNPKTVVLSAGINDIGEGDGFYKESFTLSNIQSMIDICKSNEIEIILTSLLPTNEIKKSKFDSVDNVVEKISSLNKKLINLGEDNNLKFVDFYNPLKNSNLIFNELYTFDGLHPNIEGYKIMEKIILKTLKE